MEKSKITLVGTLDKPLEFKLVGAKSMKVLNTTLMEIETYPSGKQTKEKKRWYPLAFMGETAEKAETELTTGVKLKVEVKYNTNSFNNSAGVKVYTHNFIVSEYEILEAGEPRVEQDQSEDLNIDLSEADVELPF